MNKNNSEPYKSWVIKGLYCLLYKELESTNLTAIHLVNQGNIAGPTAIITDDQTNGRGQMQTIWHSEANSNLTFTIALPKLNLKTQQQFTINKASCLAIIKSLSSEINNVKIKWPNDIYIGEKKVCGMLIENQLQGEKIKNAVIGIGLNVNQKNWLEKIPNATSIKLILEKEQDLESLKKTFAATFYNHLRDLLLKPETKINELYHAQLFGLNSFRQFEDETGVFEGKITGTTSNGNLVIETKKGAVKNYPLKQIKYIF